MPPLQRASPSPPSPQRAAAVHSIRMRCDAIRFAMRFVGHATASASAPTSVRDGALAAGSDHTCRSIGDTAATSTSEARRRAGWTGRCSAVQRHCSRAQSDAKNERLESAFDSHANRAAAQGRAIPDATNRCHSLRRAQTMAEFAATGPAAGRVVPKGRCAHTRMMIECLWCSLSVLRSLIIRVQLSSTPPPLLPPTASALSHSPQQPTRSSAAFIRTCSRWTATAACRLRIRILRASSSTGASFNSCCRTIRTERRCSTRCQSQQREDTGTNGHSRPVW